MRNFNVLKYDFSNTCHKRLIKKYIASVPLPHQTLTKNKIQWASIFKFLFYVLQKSNVCTINWDRSQITSAFRGGRGLENADVNKLTWNFTQNFHEFMGLNHVAWFQPLITVTWHILGQNHIVWLRKLSWGYLANADLIKGGGYITPTVANREGRGVNIAKILLT